MVRNFFWEVSAAISANPELALVVIFLIIIAIVFW
jgi:hypothetical protein